MPTLRDQVSELFGYAVPFTNGQPNYRPLIAEMEKQGKLSEKVRAQLLLLLLEHVDALERTPHA